MSTPLNPIILLVIIDCNYSNTKQKTDESLQTLLTFIQNGWPKNPDQTPETVCP